MPHRPCLPRPPWMEWCSAARGADGRGGGRGGKLSAMLETAVQRVSARLSTTTFTTTLKKPRIINSHACRSLLLRPPAARTAAPHPAAPGRGRARGRRAPARCWPGGAPGRRAPRRSCRSRRSPRCAGSAARSRPAGVEKGTGGKVGVVCSSCSSAVIKTLMWVPDEKGRDRVQGNRQEGNGMHVAWLTVGTQERCSAGSGVNGHSLPFSRPRQTASRTPFPTLKTHLRAQHRTGLRQEADVLRLNHQERKHDQACSGGEAQGTRAVSGERRCFGSVGGAP